MVWCRFRCNSFSFVCFFLPFIFRFALEPLLYEYGVDLAIWAHEHSYERLWFVALISTFADCFCCCCCCCCCCCNPWISLNALIFGSAARVRACVTGFSWIDRLVVADCGRFLSVIDIFVGHRRQGPSTTGPWPTAARRSRTSIRELQSTSPRDRPAVARKRYWENK